MTNFPKWKDVRDDIAAEAGGGEQAVARYVEAIGGRGVPRGAHRRRADRRVLPRPDAARPQQPRQRHHAGHGPATPGWRSGC